MSLPTSLSVLVVCLTLSAPAFAADQASGSFTTQKLGAITVSHATAYVVRDSRNARATQTEILLTDVAVNGAEMQSALDPHMTAINLAALKDRNYILLWVGADGRVGMNATYSKTMTQFLNDTTGGLKIAWTTNTAARLEGRLFSSAPLKTMDGSTYAVDVRFGVDVVKPLAGQVLPAGGGDAGKAFVAFQAAVEKKSWPVIRAALSADALKSFEKSYNTPTENAADVADLLKVWVPADKMTVTGGQLRGDIAILDVEGEPFPGQIGLSLVQMVKTGAVWQFDRAVRAGMVR